VRLGFGDSEKKEMGVRSIGEGESVRGKSRGFHISDLQKKSRGGGKRGGPSSVGKEKSGFFSRPKKKRQVKKMESGEVQ